MKPLIIAAVILLGLVLGAPKRETPMVEEYAECVAKWNSPKLCSELIISSRRK